MPAFPGPLLDQPQLQPVLGNRKADEARMRAERMMKQREHEVGAIPDTSESGGNNDKLTIPAAEATAEGRA